MSPEEFLGYPIGEMHTRHDLIVSYMTYLSNVSDKADMFKYATSYEGRKLIYLIVSSPEKIKNIESIRKTHISYINPDNENYIETPKPKNFPVIVNLGYNVHGNEPSSSEAAMLTAYTLVSSKSKEVEDYLENSIVLIDPTINPDGRDRHTQWVNSYKASPLVDDPQDAEHNEYWPGGRTNHYWFDLNRDVLLAVHPETRGKIDFHHDWFPNVTMDFHEMGTNSTYFFVPWKSHASKDPVIPQENYEYFEKLFGTFFAKGLDEIGSLYFSKEAFDKTYPGYHSSYADLLGGIGMLFEQASSRGHKQETEFGEITFPFTIRNHYVSGMNTVKASVEMKDELKEYQQRFFASALLDADKKRIKGYSFKMGKDRNKTKAFIDKLMIHKIKVIKDKDNFFVPTKQKNYRTVRSIFETNTEFRDSVFYDASAWSIANFYDIDYSSSTKGMDGEEIENNDKIFTSNEIEKSEYAYIINSVDYNIPAVINSLINNDILVSTAFKPFEINTSSGLKSFDYGSLVIPVTLQEIESDKLFQKLKNIQDKYQINIYSAPSGLSSGGIDLGSRYVSPLKKQKVMMLVGTGVRSYEAGEIWHLLDQRVGMPISKIPIRNFDRVSLDKYTTMVIVSGSYGFNQDQVNKIKEWASKGNTIISIGSGSKFLIDKEIVTEKLLKSDIPKEKNNFQPYIDAQDNRGKEQIGGIILNANVDLTHPLGFGYEDSNLPVYKNNTVWIEPSKNEYSSVVRYTKDPLVDGFITDNNFDKLNSSVSLLVSKIGKGRAVMFSDNPNFRGSWYGTNRLFLNAILLGDKIRVP
ncbi:MAG: M14 family metallopeptidase [Flavobacteriaceae bacterium]|nr:M14 family metallopeptidase [Flavobacteriaceae bacterium]